MRRASIPALACVAHRLGVGADWVLFGHVHRCGPLAGDDPEGWRGPGGSPRIANTGSWVYEPLLVNHISPPHPYWPGGAIRLRDSATRAKWYPHSPPNGHASYGLTEHYRNELREATLIACAGC